MSQHPALNFYRDNVTVALLALNALGRVPESAASALADNFSDQGINIPDEPLELTDDEKVLYQRTALEEMLAAIDAADLTKTTKEIFAELAPIVDPLWQLFVSARASEFQAEVAVDPSEGALGTMIEMLTGSSISDLRDQINHDPRARRVLVEVVIPGITGLAFDQLVDVAEHNDEVRDTLEQLGLLNG